MGYLITFLLSRMKANGQCIGFGQLCDIYFDDHFYVRPSCTGRFISVISRFAEFFPELEDEEDSCRVVFIGNLLFGFISQ